MSKLAHLALSLVERELQEAIAGLTPGVVRPGILANDVNVLSETPIEPERARFRLQAILPWVTALKEHIQS